MIEPAIDRQIEGRGSSPRQEICVALTSYGIIRGARPEERAVWDAPGPVPRRFRGFFCLRNLSNGIGPGKVRTCICGCNGGGIRRVPLTPPAQLWTVLRYRDCANSENNRGRKRKEVPCCSETEQTKNLHPNGIKGCGTIPIQLFVAMRDSSPEDHATTAWWRT